jgi:hypothetical protein
MREVLQTRSSYTALYLRSSSLVRLSTALDTLAAQSARVPLLERHHVESSRAHYLFRPFPPPSYVRVNAHRRKPKSGIRKDTINVPRRQSVEIDLIAADPGLRLYHCHMQLHMDLGFMALMKYA